MTIVVDKPKDPDSEEVFGINWTAYLAEIADDETIASSSWTVPSGLTEESDSFTDTHANVKLSGGVVGATYRVTNRITTSGGTTDDESLIISVAEQ